jgi:hypothetical protein
MGAVLTRDRRPARQRPADVASTPGRLFDPGGDPALDDLVSLTWERMATPGLSPLCLVCGEPLVWNGDARAAECAACGSRVE